MPITEPTREWTNEQLESEAVSKKDLVTFLQANASSSFLKESKLKGQAANIIKSSKKPDLINAYNKLFETKSFLDPEAEQAAAAAAATVVAASAVKSEAADVADVTAKVASAAIDEKPLFKKAIVKKGDKTRFPDKGKTVGCFYTGMLEDGTIFDTNTTGRKKQPLKFTLGKNKVIRGWEEALLTMSCGEKAKVTIESEWAYGKKGLPEAKIPPNARLVFEIELVSIE